MSFCLGLNVLNGIIFIWRKHENMSPCTGNRVITSYERIASCAGTQFRSLASDTYLKNNNLFAPNFCTCQDISIVASCRKSGWKFSNQLKICEYKQNVFIILKEYIYEVSAKRPLLLDTQRVFTNYNKKKNTSTTRTPVFWGYPMLPMITHTIEQFILDPKSKQDKVKFTK